MNKFFPVFRVGTFTDSKGKTRKWTKQAIQDIFNSYDPSWLRASFSTDHKQDGPAMGYVKTLKFENDTLYASADDLSPTLREEVRKGHFGRVSAEFAHMPDKGPYLKGVSFLGVKIPAVKGMEAEIQDNTHFEAAEEIEQHTFETTKSDEFFALGDVVVEPAPDTGTIEIEEDQPPAPVPDTDGGDVRFEDLQARITQLEEERNELQSKFEQTDAERKQADERLTEIHINQRKLEFEGWLNEKIAYGSVMPRHKEKILELLTALESVEMFEEGAGKPVQLFQDFVNELRPIVTDEDKVRQGSGQESLTDGVALSKKITAYMQEQTQKGVQVTFTEALKHVKSNNQKST